MTIVVTEYVGVGVLNLKERSYFSTSQSGMLIDPGTAIGGIDRLDVHKNSHLYILVESSQNSSGDGINVNIGNPQSCQGGTDTLILDMMELDYL